MEYLEHCVYEKAQAVDRHIKIEFKGRNYFYGLDDERFRKAFEYL